jgi:predicted flavoprotein YhiN
VGATFKEEFVTAGGINLKEVNFKTMESKLKTCILREKLNIDAITGGFNFQNAWTSGLFWRMLYEYLVAVPKTL